MRLGKIFYNIDESEYKVEYGNFTFYFSSILYQRKFTNELKSYVCDETFKIKSKYQNHIEACEYLALSLYKKIEKRGFNVLYKGLRIDENTSFKISLSLLNEV